MSEEPLRVGGYLFLQEEHRGALEGDGTTGWALVREQC